MSPVFVDDGGRTWGVVTGFGVVAAVVLFVATRDPTLDLATDLASGRPAIGTLLGWLPVGGLATWGGLTLAVRGCREARGLSRTRLSDRSMIAVLALWVGLAVSNLPTSRNSAVDRWEADVARPGAAFEQASHWCVWTIFLTAAWALVPAVLVLRHHARQGRTGKAPRHVVRRLQAAIVAPPFLVLLLVLLLLG